MMHLDYSRAGAREVQGTVEQGYRNPFPMPPNPLQRGSIPPDVERTRSTLPGSPAKSIEHRVVIMKPVERNRRAVVFPSHLGYAGNQLLHQR